MHIKIAHLFFDCYCYTFLQHSCYFVSILVAWLETLHFFLFLHETWELLVSMSGTPFVHSFFVSVLLHHFLILAEIMFLVYVLNLFMLYLFDFHFSFNHIVPKFKVHFESSYRSIFRQAIKLMGTLPIQFMWVLIILLCDMNNGYL